eukprot:gene7915-8770_t
MALRQIKIIFLALWVSDCFGIAHGNGSVANITATNTTTTKNCAVSLNLTWSTPETDPWKIKNYVIYCHQQSNHSVSFAVRTIHNKTTHVLSNLEPSTTYNITISTNTTYANGSYHEWLRGSSVTFTTASCQQHATNKDSTSSNDDIIFVIKISALILGSCICMILVAFAVFRLSARYMHRKYDKRDIERQDIIFNQFAKHDDFDIPISADNFYDHVSAMKFNNNLGFDKEFNHLNESVTTARCSTGKRPWNVPKNRYTDVSAIEKTRVVLDEIMDEPGSDYINANYVEGLDGAKSYIATQIPLENTINDFWRMVWEKEIYAVVMISMEGESNSRNEQYWPENSSVEYGNVIVKALDTDCYVDYVIRWFEVGCKKSAELRFIRLFQYTAWPSQNSSPNVTSFLEFTQKVSTYRINNRQPLVVQCLQGTLKTGAFIVLDNQLKRIEQQGNINVFHNVLSGREQRSSLAESLDIYIFIHDCILEHIMFKDKVDLAIQNIQDYVTTKKDKDQSGSTGFQWEFQDLSVAMRDLSSKSDIGALDANTRKNRFERILPYDHNRVKMSANNSTNDARSGADYINASYISSHKRKRGYIVTQSPMEATLFDFWCMIWENDSLSIAMLSDLGNESIEPYWPEKNKMIKAGKVTVRLVSLKSLKHVNVRNLEISHSEVEQTRLVRQYQYKTWPDNYDEESLTVFVDFILQCKEWNKISNSKMLTVHCRAGTGKSGVFVAVSNLIDSACDANTVNVFNTARKLTQQRIGMVQTQSQYELIYHTLAHYYKTRHPRSNGTEASTQTDDNSMVNGSVVSDATSAVDTEKISV